MSWQIIKQPNGKYCIFSSIVDNVVYYEGTKEQILNAYIEDSKKTITEKVNGIFDDLENGKKPYNQFTMSFNKMIHWIETSHGEEERIDVLKKLKVSESVLSKKDK